MIFWLHLSKPSGKTRQAVYCLLFTMEFYSMYAPFMGLTAC